MMKIAICDDHITLANDMGLFMNHMKEKYDLNISVKVYTQSLKLYGALVKGKEYDVIYLGIKMMYVGGLELAYYIRKNNPHVEIIFITEQENFDFEVFKIQPFQCMLLPMDWNELGHDLLKITEKYWTNDMFYHYSFNKVQYRVPICDIVYFHSNLRTCDLVDNHGIQGTFSAKLDEVQYQMELRNHKFIRVHQSYLVQFLYIKSIQRQRIELYNGTKVPLSGERWDDVSEKYACYLEYERYRFEGEE